MRETAMQLSRASRFLCVRQEMNAAPRLRARTDAGAEMRLSARMEAPISMQRAWVPRRIRFKAAACTYCLNRGLALLRWLWVLSSCALLASCTPPDPPDVCKGPLPVDGFVSGFTEGRRALLRLPAHATINWSSDCNEIRSFSVTLYWLDGKLVPWSNDMLYRGEVGGIQKVRILSKRIGRRADVVQHPEAWRFEHAMPHRTYPLELYPRFYWDAPDRRPIKDPPDLQWGVVGTRSPITGRPFTAMCDIVHAGRTTQESAVNGDFRKDYADAKCRGGVSAMKGDQIIFAMIDVWAYNAPHIHMIYNAAAVELRSYIEK